MTTWVDPDDSEVPAPEVLDVPDDDLSWQRNDTPVGFLATPRDIAEGNRQGREINVDDDEDSGETQ